MSALEIQPVSGALGAEIRGVDLRSMDDATVAEVRSAILEYEVVFFRAVDLQPEEQIALAARFGTPSTFPIARLMGETGPSLQVIADGPGNPPQADSWHTDVTWTAEPPAMAFLQSLVTAERGGDTMWASMTSAYDALSPAMKDFLAGLEARHDNESFIGGVIAKAGEMAAEHRLAERLREEYPPVDHPLVRTHPETGKRALLLGGGFMKYIVGLEPAESRMVMDLLDRHVSDPRFHVRWRWTEGDLAIWDERSTIHRGAGDTGEQERVIRRIEIDGTRPYFDHTV